MGECGWTSPPAPLQMEPHGGASRRGVWLLPVRGGWVGQMKNSLGSDVNAGLHLALAGGAREAACSVRGSDFDTPFSRNPPPAGWRNESV